jgi:hypothetical protein
MSWFFASGRFADVVLGFVVLEAAGLFLVRRLAGQGPGLGKMLPNLAAGAFLVLAIRVAVTGGSAYALAAPMLGALAAHMFDLAGRWPVFRSPS